MYENEPDVKKVIDTATGVEGLIRGTGVHAAGVILSSEPLIDRDPAAHARQGRRDHHRLRLPACEAIGLLKMDFLGLRNLDVIDDAITNVKANRGVEIDIRRPLPLDDRDDLRAAGARRHARRVPARRRRRCAPCCG